MFPVFGGNSPDDQYKIPRSLRFNSADSAYLSRTPAAASNRKTWTWSGWVKRATLGATQNIFAAYESASNSDLLQFSSADKIEYYAGTGYVRSSTAVFRDASAWYHVMCVHDSTQATASDRLKIYVNGSLITIWSNDVAIAQNRDSSINSISRHHFGANPSVSPPTTQFLGGYLTEVHFIDGAALGPENFGETDVTTGVWKPKEYRGEIIEYFIVAGGGGGSNGQFGGGGGGGVLRGAIDPLSVKGISKTISIGSGGNGAASTNNSGSSGSNTVAFDLTTSGGGGGGGLNAVGLNGGCGGGGGNPSTTGYTNGGTGSQGGNGGRGYYSSSPAFRNGGGGGGAGGNGVDGSSVSGGAAGGTGGAGLLSDINNSTYSGGGSGGNGSGGGSGGGGSDSAGVRNGVTNTGGGGAANNSNAAGGNGGSGVVILRYPSTYTATFSAGVTQTTSVVGSNKVSVITAAGPTDTVTFS